MPYLDRDFYVIYDRGRMIRTLPTRKRAEDYAEMMVDYQPAAKPVIKKGTTGFPLQKYQRGRVPGMRLLNKKKKKKKKQKSMKASLRTLDMIALRWRGWSLQQVGDKYLISRERVRQLTATAMPAAYDGKVKSFWASRRHASLLNLANGGKTNNQLAKEYPFGAQHIARIRLEAGVCYPKNVLGKTVDPLKEASEKVIERLRQFDIFANQDDCSLRHVITPSGLRIGVMNGFQVEMYGRMNWRFRFHSIKPCAYSVAWMKDQDKMFVLPQFFFDKFSENTHLFQVYWPQDHFADNPDMAVFWCEKWDTLVGEERDRVRHTIS